MADQRLSLRRVGQLALEEVTALVGCPAEGVVGVKRGEDGWEAMVEVLEMERIPETADILATYSVRLDQHGNVLEYSRRGRRLRSDVDGT